MFGLPENSLLVLGKQNPLRVAAVLVSRNKYFDMFILAMIILNCVTLAMYSHRPGFDDTSLGRFLAGTELYFLAVFALEMVLKIISQGLVTKPGTYLRDGKKHKSSAYESTSTAGKQCKLQRTEVYKRRTASDSCKGNCSLTQFDPCMLQYDLLQQMGR